MDSAYTIKIDCLREAREHQQVNPIITECLREFLSQSANIVPIDNIHAFIASTLLMDTYPPEIHSKLFYCYFHHVYLFLEFLTQIAFKPEFIFNSLY